MHEFLLQATDLEILIQAIRRQGHRLLGPVLRDGAIVYDDVVSTDDLPRGWTDTQEKGQYRTLARDDDAYFGYAVGPHSWKKFLQLPREKLWTAHRTDGDIQVLEVADPAPPMAFLGVRSCELHAIAIQDRVFVGGEHRHDGYTQRRSNLFIVALNCTSSAPTCFCTSMNTGPEVSLPADLTLTEVLDGNQHFFLIKSGTEAGRQILTQLPVQPASNAHRQQGRAAIAKTAEEVEKGPRQFDSSDLKSLIYRNLDSPVWDQVAERCLSCANCTMACPTCFCSTVEDTTDLSGEHAERWERWDSCFTGDFSYISGGPVRADTRSRYRQWMSHKLATWHDQFDSSGCVGCGRCITWCPVGIDITEEIQRIRESEIS